MVRQFVSTALLTGMLIGGVATQGTAQRSSKPPESTGVVATVVAIDTHKHLATLQTEQGEVYALPKETSWKVGDKVQCDRVPFAPHARLQACRPWK